MASEMVISGVTLTDPLVLVVIPIIVINISRVIYSLSIRFIMYLNC